MRAASRFNEAAGIPRGRRALRVTLEAVYEASMRPRVFPAEDVIEVFNGATIGTLLQ